MKGLFIPEITSEMFRNGCLESIETLMAEGEIYDIDYSLEQQPCDDVISRQSAIRLAEQGQIQGFEWQVRKLTTLPPVTPQHTDSEIQKMQELEQAEIQNAYELGKEDKIKVLNKIKAEIKALSPKPTAYDVVDGNLIKDAIWETLVDVLQIIDKYKESEVEE